MATLVSQQRTETRHQAFTGEFVRINLSQVVFIEQGRLHCLRLNQKTYFLSAQCRNPTNPRMGLEGVDLRLPQQAAIPDQHHALKTETLF